MRPDRNNVACVLGRQHGEGCPRALRAAAMGSNERRTWDKGAGISFFSGTSRLCSHVWLKQLDWNCAYAGWGMGGPHTSPGKRPGKCGDTVVPIPRQ